MWLIIVELGLNIAHIIMLLTDICIDEKTLVLAENSLSPPFYYNSQLLFLTVHVERVSSLIPHVYRVRYKSMYKVNL
jgi:hypothetical protein